MTLTTKQIQRYQRQLSLSEIGESGQIKLQSASVLCVGAGGLASTALPYLCAAGIGKIGIIDHDIVAVSNLHRQILFNEDDINSSKVDAAARHLSKLNSGTEIVSYCESLSQTNAFTIISQFDLVLDCTDNYLARSTINDVCRFQNKPMIYASVSQYDGQCAILCLPNSPCYRCLFPEPPPIGFLPTCVEAGVLGPLPGLLGTVQALEAIKYFTGIGKLLVNRLLIVNGLELSFTEHQTSNNTACMTCKQAESGTFKFSAVNTKAQCEDNIGEISFKAAEELIKNNSAELLDVREGFERKLRSLGGVHIPLKELDQRMEELSRDKTWIVYCQTGMRSLTASNLLHQAGYNVKHLKGGIVSCLNQ